MYFNEKDVLLCGLDHGFSTMKTTHAIFDNGVEQLGGEATLSNNTLIYNGKNYKVGEGRLPMMKIKTEDESYFLLTLAGVAKELDVYHRQNADVILAVGLPFSRFGQEKKEFRDYLYRKGEICFCYSGNDYRIRIRDVLVFPQCYAAIADKMRMYGAESLIVDIGSKTVDVIHVQKYVPVERESTSIPEALIQCMEGIKSNVYQICNKKVSEDIIRQMIVDGDAMIPEDCKSVIRDGLRNFAKGIEAKLSELGFDLEMMPVVYAGGGAMVMKRFGTIRGNHVHYLENIRANARGYEYLARQKCKL